MVAFNLLRKAVLILLVAGGSCYATPTWEVTPHLLDLKSLRKLHCGERGDCRSLQICSGIAMDTVDNAPGVESSSDSGTPGIPEGVVIETRPEITSEVRYCQLPSGKSCQDLSVGECLNDESIRLGYTWVRGSSLDFCTEAQITDFNLVCNGETCRPRKACCGTVNVAEGYVSDVYCTPQGILGCNTLTRSAEACAADPRVVSSQIRN